MFHYTNEKGLNGILKSKKLWLVSSLEMNDITDRFYANLFVTTALLKCKDEDAVLLAKELTLEDILQVNIKSLEIPFYSASFCERNDNDYLWIKYADGNKGVCIEINEDFFNEYKDKVVSENYNSLEEDTPENEIIIKKRRVEYGCPYNIFLDVLRLTKDFCINKPDGYRKEGFQNWLSLTLAILSGVIKSDNYSEEEEVRFLFQDRYNDECVNQNCAYFLHKVELIKILKKLGVDKEIPGNGKRRMELNLEEIFNENLIKSITMGDEFSGSIEDLRKTMNESGLSKVVLQNRKGKVL